MAGSRRLGGLAAGLVLAGGLLSHALDEEGLLPGVREAAAVRQYAERGAPRVLLGVFCVAVSALVGVAVARGTARGTARRTARDAARLLALVVAGQAALFASFEVAARLAAGLDVAEVFVEPAFAAGVLVQVLIAAAFVTLLLLAGPRLLSLAASYGVPWQPVAPAPLTPTARRAGLRRPESPTRGRAPPYDPSPRPAH